MKLMTPQNKEAMEIVSLKVKNVAKEGEPKREVLEMKGVALGSMPMVVHVRPVDIWEMKSLLSMDIILKMPGMVVKGIMESRKAKEG